MVFQTFSTNAFFTKVLSNLKLTFRNMKFITEDFLKIIRRFSSNPGHRT